VTESVALKNFTTFSPNY